MTPFKTYNLSGGHGDNILFAGVNIELKPQEALQIVGPNGCGKSTLLRILAGLHAPQGGHISWHAPHHTPDFHRQLTFISDKPNLKPNLTCLENLQLFSSLKKQPLLQKTARTCLEQLTLPPQSLAYQLSMGQKRKLALSRLLLHPTPLWLLDEPFNALDQRSANFFDSIFSNHLKQQGIIIFTSHQATSLTSRTLALA